MANDLVERVGRSPKLILLDNLFTILLKDADNLGEKSRILQRELEETPVYSGEGNSDKIKLLKRKTEANSNCSRLLLAEAFYIMQVQMRESCLESLQTIVQEFTGYNDIE